MTGDVKRISSSTVVQTASQPAAVSRRRGISPALGVAAAAAAFVILVGTAAGDHPLAVFWL